ncbi:hypothetical protein [Rubrivivax albus]|uniref:DUF4037 domain-containing protein n=1 Tax=Rubrivivax albus TaxID=2499835 RepID=A0A3S2X0G4_9BURK|nr:hypothetical protein [Rubrivivax albus]RVT50831.1 hypothetical protein ENE75_13540 [Rubrivivax albus]
MNDPSDLRRRLARRVAEAHAPLSPWLGLVSGSTVEDAADARSDVDMSLLFETLPPEEALRRACAGAGGEPWHWQVGAFDGSGAVVAFRLEGIETQIAYGSRANFEAELDQVLLRHDPDTPLHKLCEGVAKAEPLAGHAALAAAQVRVRDFPEALGRAMAAHWLGQLTPWRAIAQIVHRDALVWSRELQVQVAHRLLGALAGLNGCYFTTFQFKRMGRFVDGMACKPPAFTARLEAALMTPPDIGFAALHTLEAEVTALVAARWPDLDLSAVRQRHAAFAPPPG